MFNFFTTKKWLLWSWGGSVLIFALLWYQVSLDVDINQWFGPFYNMIQKALTTPGSVTLSEYFAGLWEFAYLAGLLVGTSVIGIYFTSHFVFRWRTSMVEYYHSQFENARHIEGASQRVQEDTIKFARIMESLGITFIESVMLLVAFGPILWKQSMGIDILWFGSWEYGLVTGSIVWAVAGTVLLIAVSWILRLVGVEYDIQKKEASYRKVLVIAEDDGTVTPKTFAELYDDVKKIHYKSYFRYISFNLANRSFGQASVLIAYILLAPAIVAGALTLGTMNMIIRAFNKVESALQFLFKAWPTMVELASIYKRLREFEKQIKETK